MSPARIQEGTPIVHDADIIPAGRNDRFYKPECGGCGWEGRNRRWPVDAKMAADSHNERLNKKVTS